ncbi:oxoeicosanoid receptor 1 [Phyllostomus hastatus]|uniref:oxoeicosanoid receptor 1 n=1 Tax=Phyllostomus hastatus TaxID=9423 RepID=UPI001E683053|nr:oxoeicosanoid receptor 1 [Phyllostomus hastatus]
MQHMEFHNQSAPSALPALPSLPSLSPSTLPSALPPTPFFTLLALTTTLGSPASCDPASSSWVSAFLAPVLGVEFILGLVGNGLAFFIFCVHTRPWSSNVVFLVSLVFADFLLIINLPLRMDYYLHDETWPLGDVACRINLFMLSANRTASVVFLTAIALNRYLKVVRPHHALSRASVRAAAWVAGGLWGSILLLNGHLFVIAIPRKSCLSYQLGMNSSAWTRWHSALYLLEFFLPLALILFAVVSILQTIRCRGLGGRAGPRRAKRMLAAVVAVYTICFLPSIVFGMAAIVAFHLKACPALNICSQLFHSSLAFTYLNSVLDPILYCFSSPSFLRHCRTLLGLSQGSQGPDSDENSYQPPSRLQEASRKAETIGKLQAEGSREVSLE